MKKLILVFAMAMSVAFPVSVFAETLEHRHPFTDRERDPTRWNADRFEVRRVIADNVPLYETRNHGKILTFKGKPCTLNRNDYVQFRDNRWHTSDNYYVRVLGPLRGGHPCTSIEGRVVRNTLGPDVRPVPFRGDYIIKSKTVLYDGYRGGNAVCRVFANEIVEGSGRNWSREVLVKMKNSMHDPKCKPGIAGFMHKSLLEPAKPYNRAAVLHDVVNPGSAIGIYSSQRVGGFEPKSCDVDRGHRVLVISNEEQHPVNRSGQNTKIIKVATVAKSNGDCEGWVFSRNVR